jgi:hypothetical protein
VPQYVADAGKDDLLHGAGLFAVVAEAIEQHIGHPGGGDHVSPADHAHADVLAGSRFGGHGMGAEQRGGGEGQQQSFHGGGLTRQLYCRSGV